MDCCWLAVRLAHGRSRPVSGLVPGFLQHQRQQQLRGAAAGSGYLLVLLVGLCAGTPRCTLSPLAEELSQILNIVLLEEADK